jgi:hypothetical protein
VYAKVKVTDLPARTLKRESRFEGTEEWKQMRADIERGLKPKDALQIGFTKADMAAIGLSNRRAIQRFIQGYLAEHNHPYVVSCVRNGDTDFIIVQHSE